MLHHGWSAFAPERKAKLSRDSVRSKLAVEALEDRLALSHTAAIVEPASLNVNEGTTVQFGSDVTGTNITYSWSVTDAANAVVATGDSATFSYTPADNGTYTVTLSTTDGVDTLTDNATLTVENVAPQGLISGPASVLRGQSATYTANFTDPGSADTFTYAWTVTQNGSAVTLPEGTVTSAKTFTFTPSTNGNYVISVTVTDDDDGPASATLPVTVSAVAMQGADLAVSGTAGNDTIVFTPAPIKSTTPGSPHGKGKPAITGKPTMGVQVLINGVSQGVFQPTGSLIAMGLDGDDNIQVAGGIRLNTVLLGGAGNDRLKGGNGSNVLVGGDGDDRLIGGNKNDILIGGAGSDRLNGGAGQDILVAGSTSVDTDTTALTALLTQWTTTDQYATRIATLSGTGTGTELRLGGATITDDGVVDYLTGAAHLDWFLTGETTDKLPGKLKGETLNNPVTPSPTP